MGLLGFPGCNLYTSSELSLPTVTGNHGIASRYAFFDLPIPLGNTLGVTLHGQWLVLVTGTSAPGALSAALSWQH